MLYYLRNFIPNFWDSVERYLFMATSSNKVNNNSSRKKTSKVQKNINGNKKTSVYRQKTEKEKMISSEISLLVLLAISIFLFLCNFGIVGPVGNFFSGIMFGIFGILAYIIPVFIFLVYAFGVSNRDNFHAIIKVVAIILLLFVIGVFFHLFQGNLGIEKAYSAGNLFSLGKENKKGGGLLFGTIAYLLYSTLDMVGAILVLIVIGIACFIVITEKSFFKGIKKGSQYVVSSARDDARYRREQSKIRKEEQLLRRQQFLEEEEERKRKAKEEELLLEDEKILRMNKKVSGVMLDTDLKKNTQAEYLRKENIHEITIKDLTEQEIEYHNLPEEEMKEVQTEFDFEKIKLHGVHQIEIEDNFSENPIETGDLEEKIYASTVKEFTVPSQKREINTKPKANLREISSKDKILEDIGGNSKIENKDFTEKKKYVFPPISFLKKSDNGKNKGGMNQLTETAMRLQQTLQTFGVKVTITDISQGPSVTRYELQPEQGVKVSKIVGLADDIKLNLAATDIRMEAPIPGKAAIGIEVPNKENAGVGLRDLLESKEYRDFPSKLCFAVGKDIGGKVVVTDIAKMPHMLIAGSTGSGKSVCINTIIMSLLYKASPEEVKLIMIDPKVVELSVYNGIPHLLIPVVTDPKKAAAALHWGVAEMTDRYQKFADFNVRDLKGYNAEIERREQRGEDNVPSKMPQIVIIVDELADLMMVAPGEVEESICRLAQLARAAGIHLIIATQRPSVDVITGLIKANMPSRVAFAVSSGVDSRTILDMNGAEKLLGKGDMLFYPQGYPKPARIQGAFVSDEEVSNVVDFLKNQNIGNLYREDIEDKIKNIGAVNNGTALASSENEKDSYFIEAGKFIIEKEKASIGMLQRVFKIGFNRAARIMDQLAESGVVGEEEGTKPRKVLMSMEEFENYIDEYL